MQCLAAVPSVGQLCYAPLCSSDGREGAQSPAIAAAKAVRALLLRAGLSTVLAAKAVSDIVICAEQ